MCIGDRFYAVLLEIYEAEVAIRPWREGESGGRSISELEAMERRVRDAWKSVEETLGVEPYLSA